MGCGLRKLEDRADSSPGKIYSTLKRPQVETTTDTVFEYVLLDFSLEVTMESAAKHNHSLSLAHKHCGAGPILEAFLWGPSLCLNMSTNLLLNEERGCFGCTIPALPENRFRPTVQYVSSLCELPQALQPYYTQGYVLTTLHPIILSVGRSRTLPFSLLYRAILARPKPSIQPMSMCHSVPMLRVEEWPLPGDSLTGDTVRALIDRVNSSSRGGVRFVGSVLQQMSGAAHGRAGCRSPPRTRPLHPPPGESGEYHQGALSMRVSRKGQVVSSLEADWLELTASYYRKGWSLVDSFVYWDTPKGEPVPRSMEGLFVYEERSTCPPANDTIVVEQWTVIEGSNVKTDYGPLLHTLAEFGWLLTCVLPTPIIRHDSDGNLATKQVVFLQRPVRGQPAGQKSQAMSVGGAAPPRSVSHGATLGSAPLMELPPATGGLGGFPVFGGGYPGALSHLEEGGFEQEEGKAEVTCM
ncbi:hypothetical protein NHX12_007272 [Muraenolepis orangiensis]|uniref:Raftlin family member 2 n=1 Tax=Muraenolepis orangiensis TaxID=630683 RepID=A0A9Q0DRA1_9TELE|nr:hypothetical protein NHX12_007272 [Muraenolepis orangiensis]